jgi:hypothetical protein
MTREQELEELIKKYEEVIVEVKISHTWMLKSIRHGSDETSGGNYSDELKHAIVVQEMIEDCNA